MRKTLFAATTALILAACTSMPATHTDFLSPTPAGSVQPESGQLRYRAAVPIDPGQIEFAEVVWRAGDEASLSPQERLQFQADLRADLKTRLTAIPATAGTGRPTVLRVAITRVETVSPGLNAALTVLLIGPLDRGGAALEMELLDAQTRQPLVTLTTAHYAPLTELGARFDRLASVRWAMQQAAGEFAALVQAQPG